MLIFSDFNTLSHILQLIR